MRIALFLLVGCSGVGLKDPTFPTGSSTIVAQDRSLYAVNAWDGTLSRSDWESNRSLELDLGGEPTRVARAGDELWVTLRAERSVAVLRTSPTGLPEEVDRIKVGAEPYGVVASEDGSKVFVALSQEDAVVEIDASSREVVRRFEVGNDPRWLALHPSGHALFVVYGYVHPITRIDLDSGDLSQISFPQTYLPPTRDNTNVPGDPDEETPLVPRNTGDPAVSPRGDLLVVPTLYVDPSTPGDQPLVSDSDIQPPPVPYYVGATVSGLGLQLSLNKFNPALVGVPLDPRDGEPVPGEDALAFFVGGFDRTGTVRGYVTSATFDPEGQKVYASLETANAVAVIDLRPAKDQGMLASATPFASDSGGPTVAPSEGNFWERGQVFVSVGNNPSGVAVDASGYRWVHERGNRSVGWFRTNKLDELLDKISEGNGFADRFGLSGRFVAGTNHLPPDVEAGRQLFFTADDPRMSAPGSGVSCSTCHFEGRNDGLTWAFDSNPRQTPSLAGPVSTTTPVTWTLQVPTVGSEVQITSIGRMGGQGVTPIEAAQIGSFIDRSRDVDTKDKGRDDELVERGAALFASPEVGCLSCHNGPRYTDNLTHHLYGLDVNTPPLVGVDATAPYFHDGSAETLRDVLLRVKDGSMGSTASLSDADLDALEAFLKSL
jgi:DNA-binding beta-propeller fold protein YncE/mono/diheme cytochrome c family protein